MSFSTVSADEETTRDISGLKAKHAEIKVRVEAGEITKEEARSEWKSLVSEVRNKKQERYNKKKENIQERIEKISEKNPEMAEMLKERFLVSQQKREDVKAEFKLIKQRVDSGEITREEAKESIKERKEVLKEERKETKEDFRSSLKREKDSGMEKRNEKIQERIEKISEENPEVAEALRGKLLQNEQRRADVEIEFDAIKQRADAGEITKEEAKESIKERREVLKEERVGEKENFKADLKEKFSLGNQKRKAAKAELKLIKQRVGASEITREEAKESI
jgi:polyhydroxyalkanoate synthesis regulator phasin